MVRFPSCRPATGRTIPLLFSDLFLQKVQNSTSCPGRPGNCLRVSSLSSSRGGVGRIGTRDSSNQPGPPRVSGSVILAVLLAAAAGQPAERPVEGLNEVHAVRLTE